MLKIEVIKFEAQDVITASDPIPKCECPTDGRCFPNGVFALEVHNDWIEKLSCFCFEDNHSLGN